MTFRVMTLSLVSQFIFVGSGFYYLLFWVLVLPVPPIFFGGLRWPSWVPSIFWEDFFPINWVGSVIIFLMSPTLSVSAMPGTVKVQAYLFRSNFFCVISFCLQIAEVFIFLYFFILAQFSTERLYSDIIVGVYSDTLLAWIDSIHRVKWTLDQFTSMNT